MGSSARRAAFAAALGALGLFVGGAVFLIAREDPSPPSTSTTTTTVQPEQEELVDALADGLGDELGVPVSAEEARCLADGLVEVVPAEVLGQLVEREEPLTGIHPDDREALVRVVVECLPEGSAAAVLGRSTTTTALTGLPDEG